MRRSARLPLFWRFQLAGWVLFAAATLPLKIVGYHGLELALLVTLTREPFGLLLSSLLRLVYRRVYPESVLRVRLVATVLLASFTLGLVDMLCGRGVNALLTHTETPLVSLGIFLIRSGLYLSWSMLYFWVKAHLAARERELALAHAETARREAELQLLRAQANPHFLFNALNTILATLEPGQTAPRRVVEGLADYLRYSLSHRHNALVPLGDEFDAAVGYLAVEQARFRGELHAECTIDDDLRASPVPGVIIQPLVENAVKYTRQTSEPPYRVRLRVGGDESGMLRIEVGNTGTWLEPSGAVGPHGSGLDNLRRRLALLYPGRHQLDVATANGWVTVRVRIDVSPPSSERDERSKVAIA